SLTRSVCITRSWASSSPSKMLRSISNSGLLRLSTFMLLSCGNNTHTHTHTHKLTKTYIHTDEKSVHSNIDARTLTHAHTHTHTQAHKPSVTLSLYGVLNYFDD